MTHSPLQTIAGFIALLLFWPATISAMQHGACLSSFVLFLIFAGLVFYAQGEW